MKRKLGFIISFFLTALIMTAQSTIPTIDGHSHIVTDEYLKYLGDNNALMDFPPTLTFYPAM